MDGARALAETLQIPVVDLGGRTNFPTNHHLYATFDRQLIAQADVILGLELTDLFSLVGDVPDLPIRKTVMKVKPTHARHLDEFDVLGRRQGNYQDQQRFYEPDDGRSPAMSKHRCRI